MTPCTSLILKNQTPVSASQSLHCKQGLFAVGAAIHNERRQADAGRYLYNKASYLPMPMHKHCSRSRSRPGSKAHCCVAYPVRFGAHTQFS
jgi:hypothetical protein